MKTPQEARMFMFSRLMLRMGVLTGCFIALFAMNSFAFKAKDVKGSLDQLEFSKDGTWLTLNSQNLTSMFTEVSPAMIQDFETFQASTGNAWLIMVDRITGKPSLIEGGVPWIPGTGWNNAIKASDIGVLEETAAANRIPVELVAEKAMILLKTYPNLFNVNPDDLQLMEAASGPMLDYLYNLNFQWTYHGLAVENAYMGFYLNSGNLVMFGATNICDTIKRLDPNPSIKVEDAWQRLWTYLNDRPSPEDKILEPGRLLVQPMSVSAVVDHMPHVMGQGLEYRLVYVLSFIRGDDLGTWEARVDAHSGEIISFKDETKYGHIQGGVYKTDANPNQSETSVPFPYADYAASSFADIAGNFSGTSGTSTMTGRTGTSTTVGSVEIYDYCGSISKASDGTGLIDFGSSTGTNCTTPGTGGAGNTHSSRTQYWNVAQLKIKAYTYLIGNNWLEGTFEDRVNYNSYCNAGWSGGQTGYAVFFRSGSGCGNTGELPGVSLHEVGHGLDYNDGNNFSPDGGTGEIYGDTTAMLQTHESCAGGGFTSGNCDGYGHTCTSCTGVRDADYAKHKPAEMATPTGFCNDHCPGGYACQGPCGGECHCENAPGAQANWDLAVRVFPTRYGMDVATAWQFLDKYWYTSAPNRTAAFACGVNTSSGTGNLFNQYRLVDDCDGNLSNGTPHAAGIWEALGTNHQIGNASAVNTDNGCGCASLSTPALSGVAGNGQVTLSWSAVTGASSYDVYRNETSCTSGFTKAGNTTSLNFTDSPLFNGYTYYYKIQAKGVGSCPPSAMSNCVTLTPVAGGCTAPGAPTLNTATGACAGVNLAWTAGSGSTSSYNVYRKTSPCGGTYAKIAGPITGTTYSDTTAAAGTTYAYVIKGACDAGGATESAYSNCLTASSLSTPAAPAAPTVTDDCAGLIVSWTAVSGATSYSVRRGTRSNCGSQAEIGTSTTTSYTDDTAAIGSTYYYSIVAINACGSSAASICTGGTHNSSGAPAAPTGLTATGACASVNLSWTASSGATSYNILRTTNANCSTGLAQIGTSATTTYSDTSAVAGTTYYYVVQAASTCGTSANSTCANAARLATPAAPTGLTATGSCTAVDLAWTASSGATSYEVWRTTNANCTTGAASIATPAGATYSDTTAVAGTTYYYTVKAVNACGTSAISNCANASRTSVPAAPTGLTATGNCAAVALSWSASSGATSYEVWRTTNANCTTGAASIATPTGTTYSDTTAVAGTTYYYTVKAVNACGTGAISNCANAARTATPSAPAAPTYASVSCTTLTVNWSAVSGATAYDLYRRTGACGTGAVIAVDLPGTTYNDTGLSASTQYSYYLVAKSACGSSGSGTCSSVTTTGAPSAPTGLTATAACTAVDLSWTASSGATSYEVWRTTNANCTSGASSIATPAGTTYSDTGAVAGTTYYYTVKAVNACGTSAISNCANAARLSSPGAPAITGVTDNSACAQDGLRVAYSAGSGATSHDLYRDAVSVVTGYASNALYNPGDSASHSYTVRAVNACGTTPSGAQSFTDADNSTTPTITGAGANTCPSVTVSLSTQAGMTGYQWYLGGSPIGGATASAYTAAAAGTYTVRYTNASGCTATSAGHAVTIDACIPNIVYQLGTAVISAVNEDGDGVMEAGEKWQISVTVTNNGQAPATAVLGSLQGEGLTTCNNPGTFGDVAVGGTGTFVFTFVLDADWYTSYTCGASIGFDLISKSSDGGAYTYTNDTNFATRQVGVPGGTTSENATAPTISNAKNGSKTSTFTPAFTLTPTVTSATVAFALAGHPDPTSCVQVELVAPDAAVTTLKAYGAAAASPYTVTAFYNAHGAGAYVLRVTEQAGCGGNGDAVDCTGIAMAVQAVLPGNCGIGTATCANIAPEVSDEGLHRLTATKNSNPARVDLLFEDVSASGYSLYVSNQPGTHPFQVLSNLTGARQCAIGTASAGGGMLSATALDLTIGFHPTADTTALYFLVTANNGAATEGSLGSDSAFLARTADGYCAK